MSTQCQALSIMQELSLDSLVSANYDQLQQFAAGLLILLLFTLQPSCLSLYNNVIHQCYEWHYYNNCLLLSYSCY